MTEKLFLYDCPLKAAWQVKYHDMQIVGLDVLVQPEMERGRSPLVSIPPRGRGFSRHRGLPIRSGFFEERRRDASTPRSSSR
jgi:hypothetical protein